MCSLNVFKRKNCQVPWTFVLHYGKIYFQCENITRKDSFLVSITFLAQTPSPYPSEKTGRMYQNYAGFIPKNGATYRLLFNFCSHNESCDTHVCSFTLWMLCTAYSGYSNHRVWAASSLEFNLWIMWLLENGNFSRSLFIANSIYES